MSLEVLKELCRLAKEYTAAKEPVPESIRNRIRLLKKTALNEERAILKLVDRQDTVLTFTIANPKHDSVHPNIKCTLRELNERIEHGQAIVKLVHAATEQNRSVVMTVDKKSLTLKISKRQVFGSKELRSLVRRRLALAL
jgi:hypothetical protein